MGFASYRFDEFLGRFLPCLFQIGIDVTRERFIYFRLFSQILHDAAECDKHEKIARLA
jgi:hypothetical protein